MSSSKWLKAPSLQILVFKKQKKSLAATQSINIYVKSHIYLSLALCDWFQQLINFPLHQISALNVGVSLRPAYFITNFQESIFFNLWIKLMVVFKILFSYTYGHIIFPFVSLTANVKGKLVSTVMLHSCVKFSVISWRPH